jgi:1-acyl-sn-glycerol-3-phosphate acyltransferase
LFDEKLLYDFLSHKFRSLTKYPSINKAIDRMCYTFAKFLVHRVSRSGSFPAKIVTNDFSLIEAAKHLLLKGDLVCIFPEGTLGKPGKLHRFKLGAAKILFDYYLEFKQSIPAYPIGINGTEKIYRPGMSLGLQVGSPLFIEDFVETNERQTLLNFAVELRNRVLGCVQSFQLKDK